MLDRRHWLEGVWGPDPGVSLKTKTIVTLIGFQPAIRRQERCGKTFALGRLAKLDWLGNNSLRKVYWYGTTDLDKGMYFAGWTPCDIRE